MWRVFTPSRENELHGFIYSEIKSYVEAKFDRKTWSEILRNAGLAEKEYANFLDYKDEEAVAIVTTASQMTGTPAADILEDFGVFLGGDLLRIYRPVINRNWRTLDFLANVEDTIHEIVRSRNQAAKPPALSCERISPNEVMIVYSSARKMCSLARGIARGVAEHYGDRIDITEDSCMHHGAPACKIRVTEMTDG